MTGLDKIVEQILADARASADNIIKEANASADTIIAEANAQAAKAKAQAENKIELVKTTGAARAKSSSDLKRRQAILKAKQEIITDIIAKSYDEILGMDDAAYFAVIDKMLAKYALPKSGEVSFNKKDLSRLPAGYESKVADLAKANGGTLTISKNTVDIEGGFVLTYGGIDENCSLKAMFNSEKEKLADKVNALLFS